MQSCCDLRALPILLLGRPTPSLCAVSRPDLQIIHPTLSLSLLPSLLWSPGIVSFHGPPGLVCSSSAPLSQNPHHSRHPAQIPSCAFRNLPFTLHAIASSSSLVFLPRIRTVLGFDSTHVRKHSRFLYFLLLLPFARALLCSWWTPQKACSRRSVRNELLPAGSPTRLGTFAISISLPPANPQAFMALPSVPQGHTVSWSVTPRKLSCSLFIRSHSLPFFLEPSS